MATSMWGLKRYLKMDRLEEEDRDLAA